jgi:hypothetical protein
MNRKIYLIKCSLLLIIFTLIACERQFIRIPPISITSLPNETNTPKPFLSITPTPFIATISTPNNTITSQPIVITPGEIYYLWGFNQSNSPYLVWGAELRNTMNGNCQGFICAGKDLREYDQSVWQFLGAGDYGEKIFEFNKPFDTFVITYYGEIGFDAFSGTTVDGKTVDYGFLSDGKVTTSYLDGSNFSWETIGNSENSHVAPPICGIIDPNPNGDKSYSLSKGPGGIVFNFLDQPWGSKTFSTRKGYSLTSIRIISQPPSLIQKNEICP